MDAHAYTRTRRRPRDRLRQGWTGALKTVSRLLRGVPAVYLDLDVPQKVLNGLGDHHWQHVSFHVPS